MTRKQINDFVASAVLAINPQMSYGRGRLSEWNSIRSNEYTSVWNETYGSDGEITELALPIDGWSLRIHVGKLDKPGSSPEEYEAIVDEADEIAQKLVFQMNNVISGYKLATISGFSRTPFIHRNADNVTGILLTLTIIDPATTSRC